MSPEGRITNAVFGFSSSENIYQFDAVGKKGGVNEYLSALPFAYHLMGADRETVKFDKLDINTSLSKFNAKRAILESR